MIHYGMPEAEYHGGKTIGTITATALNQIAPPKTPAHYLASFRAPRKATPDMELGSMAHLAILQPNVFAAKYVSTPVEPDFGDCRYGANKAKRDEWRAAHAVTLKDGQELISEATSEQICQMSNAVHAHPVASRLLTGGQAEVSVLWTEPETGLPGRSRLDYYLPNRKTIVDLKTTSDASPTEFGRSCAKYRYHVQEAVYRLAMQAKGIEVDHFVFVAVEKTAPFGVAVYTLDSDARALGMRLALRDIGTLATCVLTDTWPGYSSHITELSLPRWAHGAS